MLTEILKYVFPLLRDRAGSLVQLARKGFGALWSMFQGLFGGSDAPEPEVDPARAANNAALLRLRARAMAVLREREQKARGKKAAVKVTEPATTAERSAAEASSVERCAVEAAVVEASEGAAAEEAAMIETGATVEAAATVEASSATAATTGATSTKLAKVPGRRTNWFRHPPQWLVTFAPIGARVLVNALGARPREGRMRGTIELDAV